MSANNQLTITKENGRFIIRNTDVDTKSSYLVGDAETLEEAVKKANHFMWEEEVEYGLRIKLEE